MESKEPSDELAMALELAKNDAKQLLPKFSIKKGDLKYTGPHEFVLAIVGSQTQNLDSLTKDRPVSLVSTLPRS